MEQIGQILSILSTSDSQLMQCRLTSPLSQGAGSSFLTLTIRAKPNTLGELNASELLISDNGPLGLSGSDYCLASRYIGISKPLTGPTSKAHLLMRSIPLFCSPANPDINAFLAEVLLPTPLSLMAFMTAIGVNAPPTTELSMV